MLKITLDRALIVKSTKFLNRSRLGKCTFLIRRYHGIPFRSKLLVFCLVSKADTSFCCLLCSCWFIINQAKVIIVTNVVKLKNLVLFRHFKYTYESFEFDSCMVKNNKFCVRYPSYIKLKIGIISVVKLKNPL